MAEIHNIKQRIPVLLDKKVQYKWVDDFPLDHFVFPKYEADLEAELIT